jgi:hypothetical protein
MNKGREGESDSEKDKEETSCEKSGRIDGQRRRSKERKEEERREERKTTQGKKTRRRREEEIMMGEAEGRYTY